MAGNLTKGKRQLLLWTKKWNPISGLRKDKLSIVSYECLKP